MAMTDTLSGDITGEIRLALARTDGTGYTGTDRLARKLSLALTDGATAKKATGWFSASFTSTTGGITVAMGDASDPLGAAGDDVPSESPDGKDLRVILIENQDTTNFVTVSTGINALAGWIGATDTIAIPPEGFLLQTFPSDKVTLNGTGNADEIKVTANTASCTVVLSYVFG